MQQVATSGGATTTTSYIGSLEEVTSSGGTTTTTAYYGGLAESVNGALSYLLSDGLGSATESVSASSGAVTATQLYGPYGAVREQSGTLPTSKGYTGQRRDGKRLLPWVGGARLKVVCGGGGAWACGTIRPEASRPASADGMRHADAAQAVTRRCERIEAPSCRAIR